MASTNNPFTSNAQAAPPRRSSNAQASPPPASPAPTPSAPIQPSTQPTQPRRLPRTRPANLRYTMQHLPPFPPYDSGITPSSTWLNATPAPQPYNPPRPRLMPTGRSTMAQDPPIPALLQQALDETEPANPFLQPARKNPHPKSPRRERKPKRDRERLIFLEGFMCEPGHPQYAAAAAATHTKGGEPVYWFREDMYRGSGTGEIGYGEELLRTEGYGDVEVVQGVRPHSRRRGAGHEGMDMFEGTTGVVEGRQPKTDREWAEALADGDLDDVVGWGRQAERVEGRRDRRVEREGRLEERLRQEQADREFAEQLIEREIGGTVEWGQETGVIGGMEKVDGEKEKKEKKGDEVVVEEAEDEWEDVE